MPVQIRLQSQQLADIAAVTRLGPDRLFRVVRRLENERPVRPAQLHRLVTESLDGNEIAADQLLRPVLALHSLIRQRNLAVDEVLEGLEETITSADEPWNEAQIENWRAVKQPLRDLFSAPAVRIVSKATDLAYDYANLFQGARIITDIRPVYDREGMAIDAAVVSYTLRLHYDNRAGDQSLSVALDESDVLLIREQCDRALRKARLAQQLASRQNGLPTVISGADEDA